MNGSRSQLRRLKTYSAEDIPACRMVQDLGRWLAEQHALVLVGRPTEVSGPGADREPVLDLHALDGVELNRVGEVREVSDSVAHGVYDGHLGELSVVVDQYVELRNGVPRLVLRVITLMDGVRRIAHMDPTAYALSLIRRLSPAPPAPARIARTVNGPSQVQETFCCCRS